MVLLHVLTPVANGGSSSSSLVHGAAVGEWVVFRGTVSDLSVTQVEAASMPPHARWGCELRAEASCLGQETHLHDVHNLPWKIAFLNPKGVC